MDFHFNWVDLIILLVFAYYIRETWKTQLWVILSDFWGFLLSLVTSLLWYSVIANFIKNLISIPAPVANAIGFLLIAGMCEAAFSFSFSYIFRKIPLLLKKPWDRIAAIVPALGEAIILVSFLLILVISLPVPASIKDSVTDSKIGGFLVQKTSGLEVRIKEIFGGLANESLTYLIIKPGSEDIIPIPVVDDNLKVDEVSEKGMFKLVNGERVKKGVRALLWSNELALVARDYAHDMWQRGYFGHVSLDGETVVNRLERVEIDFRTAGENLALAPTLVTAHTGLMNSQGHRENILEPNFRRVGIGVIEDRLYGKLFVQVFTD